MKCSEAGERISAYLDHELEGESFRLLKSHLDECAACRELLADFHWIDDAVRGMPAIDPGSDFAVEMVRRVSGFASPSRRKHHEKSSLFQRLYRIAVDFVDMVSPGRAHSTRTLDELGDFPPLSMGYIYFQLLDLPAQGQSWP